MRGFVQLRASPSPEPRWLHAPHGRPAGRPHGRLGAECATEGGGRAGSAGPLTEAQQADQHEFVLFDDI